MINNHYMNHFADKSGQYAQFRPTYPKTLFEYLAQLTSHQDCAWDVGTGNGQAALDLSPYFQEIIATDLKQAQLNVAQKKENIRYIACPAEKTPISDHCVDLVTVAQALHWFNFDAFYLEVQRVIKPGGILAAWCYSLPHFSDEIDVAIHHLYANILGDTYWPKERRYIDDEYKTIPFPFEKISTPAFVIERALTLNECIGYLNTWSALKEYQDCHHGKNPLDLIMNALKKAWGEPETRRHSVTPIHLLAAQIS